MTDDAMTDARKRVLFVCIGNSCRSQMAEGFARAYGADVVIPASAGLAPAFGIAADTQRAMLEKNIDIRDHFPKTIRQLGRARFDLLINMSGEELPSDSGARIVQWEIPDPISVPYERHCEIRDEIERRVMNLVLELRRNQTEAL
jgi:arsenate reductase (thioredoxin)